MKEGVAYDWVSQNHIFLVDTIKTREQISNKQRHLMDKQFEKQDH